MQEIFLTMTYHYILICLYDDVFFLENEKFKDIERKFKMNMLLKKEEIASLRLTSKLLKGFADYSRLSIFEVLMDGEKSVSEIIGATGMSQSAVSNHLKCLRECDLVNDRHEGKYIYYSISNDKARDIINLAKDIIRETSEQKYRCLSY